MAAHLTAVLWAGALLGLAYGALAQWSRFCLLRGLLQQWSGQDGRLLRAFALALAVAVPATQALAAWAGIDLNQSLYRQGNAALPLILLGGVLFGVGMTLANACAARSLVLLGTGNLRSLTVLLVLGVSAYMTLSGVLAPLRVALDQSLRVALPSGSLPGLLGAAGVAQPPATWLVTAALSLALLAFSLGHRPLRQSPRHWLGGLLIGLLIAAGWWITGVLGADDFEPVRLTSLTFVAPVGESLQYLMLSTGSTLSFAVVTVGGVLVGSFLRALLVGEFRWQGYESPGQMGRSLCGAALMGVGGVLSLGCTLGQGLTGFSTLAVTSPVALAGIVLGARIAWRRPS